MNPDQQAAAEKNQQPGTPQQTSLHFELLPKDQKAGCGCGGKNKICPHSGNPCEKDDEYVAEKGYD